MNEVRNEQPSSTQIRPAVAIRVDRLSKSYPAPLTNLLSVFRRRVRPSVTALRDISFEIYDGEIFGMIGANGAGKTTLTKIIATLVQPSAGRVTVHGLDTIREATRVRARVGLSTAEERSFYWRLSATRNLQFFARLYGMSERETRARITELLAQLELEDVAHRRFGELSTGNKQRLAVARALLARPSILLLDEPTRSLDPRAARRLRALISSLATASPPTTVLLTSHNLHEIEELCARIAVLDRGEIRVVDTPRNLRAQTTEASERVRLLVKNISPPVARAAFASDEWRGRRIEIATLEDKLQITFARRPFDDSLDAVLRALYGAGAGVVSCETDAPMLLDVLESYEGKIV